MNSSVIAAILYASSTNLKSAGLQKNGYPILGAAITSTVSLFTVLISTTLNRAVWAPKFNRDMVKFFGVASLTSSVAYISYFIALSQSSIIKVQPLAGSNPLFAILFSHFFLKETEKITTKTVLGALIIVSGIIFIFL